jgi:chromosome condensin MukBEF ATPase and DNA-binding subunit MukB
MMTLEREVGALQARMETVESELQGIRSDVREIRDALVTARGSWKAICLVVGLSVSLGAAVTKLFPYLLTSGH